MKPARFWFHLSNWPVRLLFLDGVRWMLEGSSSGLMLLAHLKSPYSKQTNKRNIGDYWPITEKEGGAHREKPLMI